MTTLEKFHEDNKKRVSNLKKSYKGKEFIFVRGAWAYIYAKTIVQFAREGIDTILKIYIKRGGAALVEAKHDKEIYDRWRKRCADIARDGVEYYLVNYTNYSKRKRDKKSTYSTQLRI